MKMVKKIQNKYDRRQNGYRKLIERKSEIIRRSYTTPGSRNPRKQG